MTDRELKHMSRGDLVDVIYQYQRNEQEKDARIAELTALLEDRNTKIDNAGSIAEAALAVHHIFEAAQAAADQYLEEIRILNADKEAQGRQILQEAREKAEQLRRQTLMETNEMRARTKRECDAMYAKITELLKNYEELRGLLPGLASR